MNIKIVRIVTRKSPLALWQAEYVSAQLRNAHPELQIELLKITTQGDKILDSPLAKIGGKGLFVKELEHCLLDGRGDIAVHSMKDVPAELPEGLELPIICIRENPLDAFVSNTYQTLSDLPKGACVGTSSLRRQCQLRRMRPDLTIRDLRGNVGSRLSKLDRGDYDAIILAAAGLIRLDLKERITQVISSEIILPAIGQGAVGIECRSNDPDILGLLTPLDHAETKIRITAERALNHRLEGGCQVPIAGHAELIDNKLKIRGLVGNPDGSEIVTGEFNGTAEHASELGIQLAEDLLARGAAPILKAVYENARE